MHVGIMIEGQEGLTWERWSRLIAARPRTSATSRSAARITSPASTASPGGRRSTRGRRSPWPPSAPSASASGPWSRPLTFYHPALLAKMAVALDTLSGGRFDLGIGAGWNEHEHAMFGVPMPPLKERLDRLEAGARYIRALGRRPARDARAALLPAARRRRSIRCRPTGGSASWWAGAARSARCASSPSSPTSGT